MDSHDQPPQPHPSARRPLAVLAALGLVIAGLVWLTWPDPICSDDERSALVAVAPAGDARPAIVDSGPEEQPSTAGCGMSYEIDMPATEVADHYAEQLESLGWDTPLVERIEGTPLRYWVASNVADPVAHPDWEDVHFGLTITVLGPSSSRVSVAVRRYVQTGIF